MPTISTELLDGTIGSYHDALRQAAALLRRGHLVAFPTETVYGLGADATNPEAIADVFRAKGRPADNPLIVHVRDLQGIERCAETDERVRKLALAFMPGPLTLVLPARELIPSIARAGLPSVAVRIPDHPIALALLEQTGPLVAPSANLSGRPSPTTAAHVLRDLSGRIAAVLDGGPCRVGIESTVLDLTREYPMILRPGVIGREELEGVIGEFGFQIEDRSLGSAEDTAPAAAPRAPGMKYRHYAPAVPVRLVIAEERPDLFLSGALLLTTKRHLDFYLNFFPGVATALLNEGTLYDQFRRAEEDGVEEIVIYAEPGELPEGLLNRVTKAASQT